MRILVLKHSTALAALWERGQLEAAGLYARPQDNPYPAGTREQPAQSITGRLRVEETFETTQSPSCAAGRAVRPSCNPGGIAGAVRRSFALLQAQPAAASQPSPPAALLQAHRPSARSPGGSRSAPRNAVRMIPFLRAEKKRSPSASTRLLTSPSRPRLAFPSKPLGLPLGLSHGEEKRLLSTTRSAPHG